MPVINNGPLQYRQEIFHNALFLPFFCYMMKNTARPDMQISLSILTLLLFIHSFQELRMIKHTHSIRSYHLQKDRSQAKLLNATSKKRIWIYNSFLVVARIFVPSSLRRSLIFSSILVISFYFLFFSYLLQFKSFLFLWKSFMLFIHQKT